MEIRPDGTLIDKITTYDEYLEGNVEGRKSYVYTANLEDDAN